MKGVLLALKRAAQRRESATSLAVFRIFVGLCLLCSLLLSARGGALELLLLSPAAGGVNHALRTHWLHALLPQAEHSALWSLYSLTALGAACTTLGLGGRWLLLFTQQCFVALSHHNSELVSGHDTLLCVALLLLACSGCTQTLSLDCWRRHRQWVHQAQCFAWPRYALICQLLLMYGSSGLQKLGLSWTPLGGYSALYYVLHDPVWIRVDYGALTAWSTPLALATAVTWHWEQCAPLLLLHYYYRATPELGGRLRAWFVRHDVRVPFAAVGAALHLGIFGLLDVGPFSIIALAYYVNLWSAEQWRGLLRRDLRLASAAR